RPAQKIPGHTPSFRFPAAPRGRPPKSAEESVFTKDWRSVCPRRNKTTIAPAIPGPKTGGWKMRIFKGVALALCTLLLCAVIVPSSRGDLWNKRTVVTFNDSVEIPGQVLPAGTYVFKLGESASNRHIVQVWNADEDQILATILAIPAQRLEPQDDSVFQ